MHKICFKGDEIMALVKGYPLPAATQAKLLHVKQGNPDSAGAKLAGLRFHYDMQNQFYLFMQQNRTDEEEKPIPDLTPSGYINYEELD
jgi:hypothetical protein